ncbi:MAG TPA: carboxylesterase/lipase family protein [Bryobacteraceae bacterium]|jgi:para-nitrobenzyl esterase|nr:carboxylesterase/lipase family protein [Bryobacteraceae bacterium]
MKSKDTNPIDRRSFLGRGTAAASALIAGSLRAAKTEQQHEGPVVETIAGKLRGTVIDKVYAFKGVPYGATTEGAGRFMPPVRPRQWADVRDASQIGHRSPQQHGILEPLPEVGAADRQNPMGEDCLVVNVWSNGLKGGHKRPVMVWLHGGGFASGSGDYSIYDGANLARKRDVVVVTVNHRLNVFGYLYLAEIGGPKYADASNAGHLDIILALEWVRDNIANFGGDPANVTIFGQSGGGGKVATLMAMPGAKGLFHRAICESGAAIKGQSKAAATKTAQNLLARLNLKPDQLDQLQSMPFDKITDAIKMPGVGQFEPVVDGKTLTHDPFDPGAPEESASIPLLIGSVEEEINFFPGTPLDPIDDADLHKRVRQTTRTDDAGADKIIAIYKKGRPMKSNVEIYQIIASDAGFSGRVHTEADRKAAQGKAPVYKYYFTWQSGARDGKLRSFHTLEIPLVFENLEAGESMTGKGADRAALSDKMSAAWAAFARTGNPNVKGLPRWPAFTTDQRATMIFNDECKLVNDPYKEARLAIAALPPAGPGRG